MSMSSSPSSPAFSHEEHIILAPLDHAAVVVRLETSSLLQQENATTPFSSVLRNLALEYDITRLLVKTGSISTNKASNHPLQDEWSTGPSGISILVELSNADDRFFALLKALVACRLVLAPLDAVTQPRLHRHIYRNDVSNESVVEFQVMLPLEGSTVASEGVKSFFGDETSGILSSSNAKAISHVLLGDSTEIPVLYKHRRSMWMDLERNCKNAEGRCSMSLRRGLEYGVQLSETTRTKASLSQLVPLSNLEACPFADSSRLVIKTLKPTDETTLENRFQEQLIENWNAGTVLDLSTFTPPQVSNDPYVYADRTIVRPHGVANMGRLFTRIRTNDLPCPILHVAVVEVLPPYLAPLWDTWTPPLPTPPQLVRLRDGTMMVQYNVTLGANQDFTVSLDYEPVLLPFQQFPADPNRGMELPPVVFRVESTNCTQLLYSSPILLMPPVPDMSMPFNVISLTCTLYAFVIGSLANLLVRKSSDKVKKKLHPDQHKSKLETLKEKIRHQLSMFQKKKDAETSGTPKSKSDNTDDDVAENEIPAKKDKDNAAS